jgi:hypothetical protein
MLGFSGTLDKGVGVAFSLSLFAVVGDVNGDVESRAVSRGLSLGDVSTPLTLFAFTADAVVSFCACRLVKI